ncbi:MAG: hypothetical protein J6U22_03150 [Bacteroidaceae bacterium]|nr:hypothetical protein [Bacteroidaceae bacterium]
MLSNYSSLLEFLAGVYLTMCLDNLLTQKIWTVDYFAAFKKSLEELSFGGNTSIASEVVDKNRDQISVMQAQLTKKSVFMLVYIFLMLLLGGISTCMTQDTTIICLMAEVLTIQAIIILFFSGYVFQEWSRTFWFILTSLLLMLAVTLIPILALWFVKIVLKDEYIVLMMLFVAIYPIIWQIFKVWVHRSLFYGYVNRSMLAVKDEYENVLDIINNNGDTSKLPVEYGKILQANTIKHKNDDAQKAIDSSIKEYTDLLQSKLRKIGYETSIFMVIWSSIWTKKSKYNNSEKVSLTDTDSNNNGLSNYKKK